VSAASLAAVSPVLVVGALMCSMPAVTRPTLQFGVRVPRERARAPIIGRERRAYYWRTAAIGVCCTLVAVTVQGHWPSWLTRIILLPELAAGFGCFWVARRKIAAVKNADDWFAGLRQTIVRRSRPDIEAADPAASTLRYRRFLAAITRALLTMAALADLGLLLIALPDWHVYRLSGIGRALPVLPFAAGVLLLAAVAARAGQGGSRLNGNVRGLAPATGTDRDDDRFWKAGLLYINRDDPALVVGARFGVGWMLNFGNPVAWLLLAGFVAWWAGLAVLGAAAGM